MRRLIIICVLFASEWRGAESSEPNKYDEGGNPVQACRAGEFVDKVANHDGYLRIWCNHLKCNFDHSPGLRTCLNSWYSYCPSLNYVERIKQYSDGDGGVYYKVWCCTHSLIEKHYSGQLQFTFAPGEDWDKQGINANQRYLEYLGSIKKLIDQNGQQLLKIGTATCRRDSSEENDPDDSKPESGEPNPDPNPDPNDPEGKPPAPGPSTGGGGPVPGCFPANATVQTKHGEKRMDELEIGDEVLSSLWDGKLASYQRVIRFLHRDPAMLTEFVRIQTEDGRAVSLSPKHLLPIFPCDEADYLKTEAFLAEMDVWFSDWAVFASRAEPGLCVLGETTDGRLEAQRVVDVSRESGRGIYSPLLSTGVVVVDGVQTSCYSSVENHFLVHGFMSVSVRLSAALSRFWDKFIAILLGQDLGMSVASTEDVPVTFRLFMNIYSFVTGIAV